MAVYMYRYQYIFATLSVLYVACSTGECSQKPFSASCFAHTPVPRTTAISPGSRDELKSAVDQCLQTSPNGNCSVGDCTQKKTRPGPAAHYVIRTSNLKETLAFTSEVVSLFARPLQRQCLTIVSAFHFEFSFVGVDVHILGFGSFSAPTRRKPCAVPHHL